MRYPEKTNCSEDEKVEVANEGFKDEWFLTKRPAYRGDMFGDEPEYADEIPDDDD